VAKAQNSKGAARTGESARGNDKTVRPGARKRSRADVARESGANPAARRKGPPLR
jgi:hypothetical protein